MKYGGNTACIELRFPEVNRHIIIDAGSGIRDLANFMLPTLTMIDCYRILLRNGPTGGNLEDVATKKAMVAGTDPVALDAYVAKAYWNLDAEHMPYLHMAAERGLGIVDFEKLTVKVSQLG